MWDKLLSSSHFSKHKIWRCGYIKTSFLILYNFESIILLLAFFQNCDIFYNVSENHILCSAIARLEDFGGEKSHAERTGKRRSGVLSCQEWLSQNLSGDPAGTLRLAVTEPPCWPYPAQEHCPFFFLLLRPYPIFYQIHQCYSWVQSHNTSGLTETPRGFSTVLYRTPSPGNTMQGHHRHLAQSQREVFILN